MESVCTLCGIGISYRFAERWLREFRAVYVQHNDWKSVKLSGVGIATEDEFDPVCPEDCSRRYDDQNLDPDSTIFLDLNRANLALQGGTINSLDFRGFGFHSVCWSVLTSLFKPDIQMLFHICLSMPISVVDGIPGILDWSHDYGGTAFYSKTDDVPMITAYYSGQLDQHHEANTFKSEPYNIPSLRRALESPDRLQSDYIDHHFSFNGDTFHSLPSEILHDIVTSLLSIDVVRLRMASPVFAQLDLPESFWRSRFQAGHEFSHVFESSDKQPASWKTLYRSLRIFASDIPALANRKRIWGLSLKLQSLLSQVDGKECIGTPVHTLFEPEGDLDNIRWHTASRCLRKAEMRSFDSGSRALRARSFHTSLPLQIVQLTVSFIDFNGLHLVSGLTFLTDSGKCHSLGYIHPSREEHIIFSNATRVCGWKLSLDTRGVRAIAVISDDDKVSQWAGEPGDCPRWHLANPNEILDVKAEFDSIKLVSLSRNAGPDSQYLLESLYQNFCLWHPDVPPSGMRYNDLWDNEPPGRFDQPFKTVFWNDSQHSYPDTLIQIIAWTYDMNILTGLEFKHSNSSKDVLLGHNGPYDDMPIQRSYDPPQDRRLTMTIDGIGGEDITEIQVTRHMNRIHGLKIRTSFGREEILITPSNYSADNDQTEWLAAKSSGSRAVGMFVTCGHHIYELGLISTGSANEPPEVGSS